MSLDWTRAIAYLKREVPDDGSPALSLERKDSPVLKNLNNGLLVSYIVDEGNSFSYVQNRHIDAAGIEGRTLHNTAINNLYSVAEKHLKIQAYGSVFAVFMEGNFEASALLLDTVWDISLAQHVRSGFVAAIPTRDVLAFGDFGSNQAISELRAIVERTVSSKQVDHQLSTSLYRRIDKGWIAIGDR